MKNTYKFSLTLDITIEISWKLMNPDQTVLSLRTNNYFS